MPRKRFQRGSVRPRKHGRRKVWVAQWRENGDRRSKVLGMCSEIPKSQAETMLEQILRPINEESHRPAPIYTFKQYIENSFLRFIAGSGKNQQEAYRNRTSCATWFPNSAAD